MEWKIGLLLLVTAFAGCTSADEPAESAAKDAAAAPGRQYDAGGVTVKVIEPSASVEPGEREVVLWVHRDGAPVTGASVEIEAWMSTHGHGCGCNERDPVHEGDGVYRGQTDFIMDGEWVLRVDVDGERIEVPVLVGDP